MKREIVMLVTFGAIAMLAGGAVAAGPPPDDLVKLERRVSLELAHVRDAGPTDPDRRQQLADANRLDREGEDAIKSGDFQTAYDRLHRADAILVRLLDD